MEPNAEHHPQLTRLITEGADFGVARSVIHPRLYEAAIATDDFTAFSSYGQTEFQAVLNLEEQLARL